MAQKESQHKELVDSLHGQLAQVQRAHDELTTLSRDQVGRNFDYHAYQTLMTCRR
jgi:hypothetical protein